MFKTVFVVLGLCGFLAQAGVWYGAAEDLCDEINTYRNSQGLPDIPLSAVLMETGEQHVKNFIYATNNNVYRDWDCTSPSHHDWYDKGNREFDYEPCCLEDDGHCMWDKPTEIAGLLFIRICEML